MNFAPTELSKNNLLKENIPSQKISLVGNTIVDMIHYVLEKENIEISYQNKVFITAHRRENIGKPLENIATAIKELAVENPEIEFHWALHPNPNTRKNILSVFDEKPQNIIFTEPLDYVEAITKMSASKLLISDSGGIQEEAPSLQKRVLILRHETERPEVLDCGCGILVGDDSKLIKDNFYKIWNSEKEFIFNNEKNPFGEGNAAEKIYNKLV